MIASQSFSAEEWIRQSTLDGDALDHETMAAVASFTVMWNFFEGVVCAGKADVPGLEAASRAVRPDRVPEDSLKQLEDCLRFWTFRYVDGDGMNDRFNDLNFRKNDPKLFVAEVLRGQRVEFEEKALALLLIVYRLRNNLFHGLKSALSLRHQVPNLNTASRCLGLLAHASDSHLVWRQSARRA